MTDARPAIRISDLSKTYKRYATPGQRIKDLVFPGSVDPELFQALKPMSLEVPRGTTLGIVGRNGAGKSTLLQLITNTLAATTGTIEVSGRISALLELGSGFNPEFTGIENIFFNGQLIGLKAAQIREKLDEIIAFADIGDFIHKPINTYSTGMVVRLAFAVATSHHPDVLIVDEALAVGDEIFQRKCFSRIQEMRKAGATILFVSHSASMVTELCDSAILLDGGELLMQGHPKQVIAQYHKLIYAPAERRETVRAAILAGAPAGASHAEPVSSAPASAVSAAHAPEDYFDPHLVPKSTTSYELRGARIEDVRIESLDGRKVNVLTRGDEYLYRYTVTFLTDCFHVRFGMLIKTLTGIELGGGVSGPADQALDFAQAGQRIEIAFRFRCALNPAVYFLNAGVVGTIDGTETYLHRMIDVVMFRVPPSSRLVATGLVDFGIQARVEPTSPGA